jgi:hypothetical protein
MHFIEMFYKGQSVLQLRNTELPRRVVLLDVFANTLQYKHNEVSKRTCAFCIGWGMPKEG